VGETKPPCAIHEAGAGPDRERAEQSQANATALPGEIVDTEVQASSVRQDTPLDRESIASEADIPVSQSSGVDEPSTYLRTSEVPGPEQQAAMEGGREVSEGEALKGKDEREAHKDEVRSATEPTLAQAAQDVISTEQAATAVLSPTSPTEVRPQPNDSSQKSTPVESVDAIGAKGATANQEHVAIGDRAEAAGPNRTEAPTEAGDETASSEAGPEATPAGKPDQLPALSGASPRGRPADAPAVPNAPIRIVAEVPLGAVPVEIGLKSLAGINHFEIRLDPAELGRIEVRLEIDQEGGVKAHLSVDRVETLALLQRDSKALERAFDQAGLKLSDGSVDLSLRDQHAQGQGRHEHAGDQRRDGSRHPSPGMRHDNADPALAELPRRLWRGTAGIDVRI
jgi:flagellar hook-length control protein FliK